jgi:hypothetical protein
MCGAAHRERLLVPMAGMAEHHRLPTHYLFQDALQGYFKALGGSTLADVTSHSPSRKHEHP